MFSANNTYATVEDVESRLTEYSVTWAADRDSANGSRSAKETSWIEAGIEWANNLIDAAIIKLVVNVSSRPANAYLRDRCVDLSAFRILTIGGVEPPQVITDDYNRTLEWLDQIASGALQVPGLDTGGVLASGRRMSGPRYFSNQVRGCRR